MNEPDPVPFYTSTPGPSENLDLPGYESATDSPKYLLSLAQTHKLTLPITHYPSNALDSTWRSPAYQAAREIVKALFSAISHESFDNVSTMLELKLVTLSTTDVLGRTPLIAATTDGQTHTVQQLLNLGADVNGWGEYVYKGPYRTALMVAAAAGNLKIVKILINDYQANDALIAPDGQLALRLAVEGGHTSVVKFLPARRGGGWKRWKTQHEVAMRRAKEAMSNIIYFFKILLWYVPKALLWDLPRDNIFRPVKKGVKWCWEHRRKFGPWCKRTIVEIPDRAKKAVWWMGRSMVEVVKGMRKFVVETLPRCGKKFAKFCWVLMTRRIPAALKTFGQWLWKGMKALGQAFSNLASRIASFLHTAYTAVVTFFRNLTLLDIWNGFLDILRTIFVGFPCKIWHWMQRFGEVSYQILETLLGCTGEVLWWIGRIGIYVIAYVPKRLWRVVSSLGDSVAKAGREVMVWIDPKK